MNIASSSIKHIVALASVHIQPIMTMSHTQRYNGIHELSASYCHSASSSLYSEYYMNTYPRVQKYCGFNSWQWLFFSMASIQLACITILTTIDMKSLIDLNKHMTSSFVINITILIICVISISFLIYGIFWNKQNEICLFLLAMSLCTFYISIEFAFTVPLCASLSLTSILLITSKMVIIYSREYSIIGVAPTLLSMYRSQCFFLVLLKFDFLCSVSFALFNVGVSMKEPMWQYLALGTFLTVSAIHWISGRFAVIKEIKICLLLFVSISTLSLLWVPLQFVFLETCFASKCSNQKLLLSYGSLVSSAILIIVRIWLFMHLLKVYRNFGYGLADSAFIGLATETTRLLMRSQNYRQPLEL
ncbi:hypothetical protein BLOT_002948 [Blomia tropicalis]|nr:hypothetical protein BLOT_002948 [Blomia tropicalis]